MKKRIFFTYAGSEAQNKYTIRFYGEKNIKKMGPKIQKKFLFILHQFEIRFFAIFDL